MRKTCNIMVFFLAIVFSFNIEVRAITTGTLNKFPQKYDLRQQGRVTTVKEQGELGSCWALTSVAALESSIKTIEGKDYDLSENNLITQLSNTYEAGFDRAYDDGGDDALAAAYYASWRGPVLEKDDPYSKLSGVANIVTGLKPIKHVQEIIFLPQRKNSLDNDLIKEHVMKYGAISVSMWKGTPQTFGEFYNEDKFAWYYPHDYMNKEGNGHAVDIVGWDDDFPKENFKIVPPGNGAFIVKNTKGPLWGQADRKKNIGGYFYISYYDMMIGSKLDSNVGSSVFTRVDNVNNYNNIYQYDILGYTKSIKENKTAQFANVFEINKGINEKLSAVSFYTLEENLNYEIWINTDFTKDAFNNMVKAKSGNIRLPGYHTVDLDSKIDLIKDKKIVVLVKLISSDINPSIAIESPTGLMSSQARSELGESFYLKDTEKKWIDLTSVDKNSNVCLKIFTTNGAVDNKELLKVEDMKRDVDFLVDWTKNHQPVARQMGYNNRQKETIKWVYSKINKPMTKDEFYPIINRLFTMMGDGHTSLHYKPTQAMYLNIPFVWLQSGIYVNKGIGDYLPGDKILSIGGKAHEELTKMLYEQISSENDYWIHENALACLTQKMYLDYFNLVNNDNTVDIKLERDNKVIVRRETLDDINKISLGEDRKWLSWHLEKENNLGYFQFDEWPSGEKLEEVKRNMDSFFSEVSKNEIKNIVFDIRENEGGTSGALNYLFRYLITGKIYIEGNEIYTPANQYPKASSNLIFKGNTYFLISNRTFSCSVLATTILKDNGIVRVIGEPSGENPAFNRHGTGSDGSLPRIGWEFMMTSYKPKRPLNKDVNEKAIFPDIPVYTAIEDVLTGRDIQMERMREIARGGNYVYAKGTMEALKEKAIVIMEGKDFVIDRDENITINIKPVDINNDSVWIENTIDQSKLPVEVERTTDKLMIRLPEEAKKGATYYLVISYGNKKYSALMTIKPDVRIDTKATEGGPNNQQSTMDSNSMIDSKNYNSQWKYICIQFKKEIKNDFDRSKIIIKDIRGDSKGIRYADNGVDYKNVLIIKPAIDYTILETYTLFISKGTIEFVDGEKYNEDINLTFTVGQ